MLLVYKDAQSCLGFTLVVAESQQKAEEALANPLGEHWLRKWRPSDWRLRFIKHKTFEVPGLAEKKEGA